MKYSCFVKIDKSFFHSFPLYILKKIKRAPENLSILASAVCHDYRGAFFVKKNI